MQERFTAREHEQHIQPLGLIVERYFPDDADFLAEFDQEDLIGYLYGALIEAGQDPDEVFEAFGVVEVSDEI